MHVLCDQGLGSRQLWRQITDLDWHPVLRYPLHITFRPTAGQRIPARELAGGPGTLWLGAGTTFGRDPLPGTPVVLHVRGHREPWLLPADTPPAQTDVALYACRHWIEQGIRGCLRCLLVRNRLWARIWLPPTPRPDRAAGLRCLSPPAA